MPRVALHTLGCKLNYAESGSLALQFEEQGFEVVPFGEPAHLTVINTCTVTSEAERKCRQAIRRAVSAHPEGVVVVTGCYAQLRPDEIAAIKGVDFVFGTTEKGQLARHAASLTRRERPHVEVSCIDQAVFSPACAASNRTRAFMKVQDGCDYTCSFCTIPVARGRSRSGRIETLVREAERVGDAGFREIVLSGVNIGLFGLDTGASLLDLLRALDGVPSITRYRISSIEPNLLTDEIIDFVAGSRAFQPHFHVPMQSGDDEVLGAMRRRYRREVYRNRIERIVAVLPDAGIGADVIVGFPNEDANRFDNTVGFIDDLPLSYLHVFTYSERPGTVAPGVLGPDVVPRRERTRRNSVLRLLSEKKRRAFACRHLGTTRPVLWEAHGAEGLSEGFTDNHIRVRSLTPDVVRGEIDDVVLGALGSDGTVTSAMFELPVISSCRE